VRGLKRKRSVAVKVLGVVAMALLLSSCLKLNMDLTVSSNNTVSGTVIFAMDKQLLEATGQTVDQVLQSPIVSPGTQGVTTAPYDDGKYVGQEVTFAAVSITQFSGAGADELKIVREGDQFKVSGVLDLSGGTQGTGGGIPAGTLGTADIWVKMTFPGNIISSNGKVDGNSVTWEPKVGERAELQAVASAIPSSSSFPWLWIGIAVAAVVVLLAVVLAVTARRRGKKGAEAPPAGAVTTSELGADASGGTLPPPPPPPGETP